MKTIKELKASIPQKGTLAWIGLRTEKRGDVKSVTEVIVNEEQGLEGDHYGRKGKRMVTLIQKEHLDAVANILEQEVIDPSECRRNLVVSGINLNALQDAVFQIGNEVVLEGTGFCHPCSRMEHNLGPGGYNAMRGHGGITARVKKGGAIAIGNSIKYLEHTE